MIRLSDNVSAVKPALLSRRSISIILTYILVFWVLLPAFLIGTGVQLDKLWPATLPEILTTSVFGWLFVVAGGLIMIWSMLGLWRRGKGLPISHLPPTTLVANGLFRIFRHPIYIGYSLAFIGVSLLIGSFWCLFFSTPLLIIGWVCYTRFYEEPYLLERFGLAYEVHRQKTPLFFSIPGSSRLQPTFDAGAKGLSSLLNRWANQPVLYRRGDFILVTYGLFCAIGGFFWAESMSMSLIMHGFSAAMVGWYIFGIAVAISVGSALFWWLGHWKSLIHLPWWGLGRIGFVSYGGLIGAVLFTSIYSVVNQVALLVLLDTLMQGMYFSYAFGRLGCLTYGCCYGACHAGALSIEYISPDAKLNREGSGEACPRHPVQFYAFIHGILMVLAIAIITQHPVPMGLLTALTLILGGLGRTVTEFYRGRPRSLARLFTLGHLGSGAMILSGWIMLFLIDVTAGSSPISWSWPAFRESVQLLPVVVGSSLLILIIYGVQWKRLGYRFGG